MDFVFFTIGFVRVNPRGIIHAYRSGQFTVAKMHDLLESQRKRIIFCPTQLRTIIVVLISFHCDIRFQMIFIRTGYGSLFFSCAFRFSSRRVMHSTLHRTPTRSRLQKASGECSSLYFPEKYISVFLISVPAPADKC